jgi:hypothetical protein
LVFFSFLGGDMKVFLISGKARHGKDTTGNFLQEAYEQKGYKVCRSQISKYLKFM